jgi:hypothetical protein
MATAAVICNDREDVFLMIILFVVVGGIFA